MVTVKETVKKIVDERETKDLMKKTTASKAALKESLFASSQEEIRKGKKIAPNISGCVLDNPKKSWSFPTGDRP